MPSLEIFEGKSITWILLMLLGLAVGAVWKSGKDFFKNMFNQYKEVESKTEKILQENSVYYREQIKTQKEEAQKREEQLKLELKTEREKSEKKEKMFVDQLKQIAGILEKMQSNFNEKFDKLSSEITNIKEKKN